MNLSTKTNDDMTEAKNLSCPWIAQFRLNFQDEIESWTTNGFFDENYLQYINCHW